MTDPNALVVLPAAAVDALVREAVADATARVIETHAAEVRELRVGAKPFLTADEVGTQILGGITGHAVRNHVRRHGLPFYRPGGRMMFCRVEVDEWVRASRAA